jgi:hypothetical protein
MTLGGSLHLDGAKGKVVELTVSADAGIRLVIDESPLRKHGGSDVIVKWVLLHPN